MVWLIRVSLEDGEERAKSFQMLPSAAPTCQAATEGESLNKPFTNLHV